MTQAAFGGTPFSTRVDLWLEASSGKIIRLNQVGPGFVICRSPEPMPPGPAKLAISVDGQVNRRDIFLDDGMSPDEPETHYHPLDDIPF
jgi:hypothetical protein